MNCDIMLHFVFCIISIDLLTLRNFNTLTHFNSEKKRSFFLKTKRLCYCCGSISHVLKCVNPQEGLLLQQTLSLKNNFKTVIKKTILHQTKTESCKAATSPFKRDKHPISIAAGG